MARDRHLNEPNSRSMFSSPWWWLVPRQAAQEEERRLVARVVHLMRNEDTDCYFRMLVVARRHLGQVINRICKTK